MSPLFFTHVPRSWMAKVKSGEGYPNRVASFGLNRAHMKIRTPNLPLTDNTSCFGHFGGFLRFVVWPNIGHFGGVYESHKSATECAFLFFFCLCNVSKHCFIFLWKANKAKVGK